MCGAELPSSNSNHVLPFQQAQEMVQEILRERDHGGFSERNDFGSRMGGGVDVSLHVGAWSRHQLSLNGFKTDCCFKCCSLRSQYHDTRWASSLGATER